MLEGVKQDSVLIKDKAQKLKTIPVSKYKKEEFMRALARYVGKIGKTRKIYVQKYVDLYKEYCCMKKRDYSFHILNRKEKKHGE